MKTATVIFEGQPEAAEELSFEPTKEGWSEYLVEGGLTFKIKNVTSRILRLLNKTKPDGSPFYVIEGTAVVAVINPDAVIRPLNEVLHAARREN